MDAQSPRRRMFALAALVCFVVGLLASASSALAVQSNQYDLVQNRTSCPTRSPYLNNPEFPEVACGGIEASHLSLKLGNLATETNSPTTIGFALVQSNPALNSEVCPWVEQCYRAVPRSTVIDAAPIGIELPLPGHHRPHHSDPPHHSKSHGGHGDSRHGHGDSRYGHGDSRYGHGKIRHKRKLLHGVPQPSIEATIEAAGDLHAFALSAEPTGPLFFLPFKIHIEGGPLGDDCYIGSNANPIDAAFVPIAEPEVGLLPDPNELPVLSLSLNGLDMASNSFALPAARGCGSAVGFGKQKHHPFDDLIDSTLGLPSPSGQNLVALAGSNTALALSYAGGATLRAAFRAAH